MTSLPGKRCEKNTVPCCKISLLLSNPSPRRGIVRCGGHHLKPQITDLTEADDIACRHCPVWSPTHTHPAHPGLCRSESLVPHQFPGIVVLSHSPQPLLSEGPTHDRRQTAADRDEHRVLSAYHFAFGPFGRKPHLRRRATSQAGQGQPPTPRSPFAPSHPSFMAVSMSTAR